MGEALSAAQLQACERGGSRNVTRCTSHVTITPIPGPEKVAIRISELIDDEIDDTLI